MKQVKREKTADSEEMRGAAASAFSPTPSTSSQPPMKAGAPPQLFSPFQAQHQQQMVQLPHPGMMELSRLSGPPPMHQHPDHMGEPTLILCTHQESFFDLALFAVTSMLPLRLLRLSRSILRQLLRQAMLCLQEQRRLLLRAWPGL